MDNDLGGVKSAASRDPRRRPERLQECSRRQRLGPVDPLHPLLLFGLSRARELGIGDRVSILPMEAPEHMVTLAAEYDLGLSLETDATQSRRLCLTNKIFTYLLAGIPVLMSDTPAQSELAPQLGAAGLLGSLDDPLTMSQALDRLGDPAVLGESKAMAWRLGRERYNWDYEKKALLASVAAALGTQADPSAGGEVRP